MSGHSTTNTNSRDTVSGPFTASGLIKGGSLRISGISTFNSAISAPVVKTTKLQTSYYILTLPVAVPLANQLLISDITGQFSWVNASFITPSHSIDSPSNNTLLVAQSDESINAITANTAVPQNGQAQVVEFKITQTQILVPGFYSSISNVLQFDNTTNMYPVTASTINNSIVNVASSAGGTITITNLPASNNLPLSSLTFIAGNTTSETLTLNVSVNGGSAFTQIFTGLSRTTGSAFTLTLLGLPPLPTLVGAGTIAITLSSQSGITILRSQTGVLNPVNTYYTLSGSFTGNMPVLSMTFGFVSSQLSNINALVIKNYPGTSVLNLQASQDQTATSYGLVFPPTAPIQINQPLLCGPSGIAIWGSPSKQIILSNSGSLTSVNITGLFTTPITLVPAQGSGTLIVIDQIIINYVFGTTQYSGGGNLSLTYQNNTGIPATQSAILGNFITDIQSGISTFGNGGFALNGADSSILNYPIVLSNATGSFFGGNGTLTYTVHYRVFIGLV